jgi:GntR family transcriptional regulator
MDAWTEPEVAIRGGAPIARQVEGQIRRQILLGLLRPGEELPTVRGLAVGLSVNPNVIGEAYATLEREGLLTPGEVSGPRVAALPYGSLDELCREFLDRAEAEGYTPAEVSWALGACIDGRTSHGESH